MHSFFEYPDSYTYTKYTSVSLGQKHCLEFEWFLSIWCLKILGALVQQIFISFFQAIWPMHSRFPTDVRHIAIRRTNLCPRRPALRKVIAVALSTNFTAALLTTMSSPTHCITVSRLWRQLVSATRGTAPNLTILRRILSAVFLHTYYLLRWIYLFTFVSSHEIWVLNTHLYKYTISVYAE